MELSSRLSELKTKPETLIFVEGLAGRAYMRLVKVFACSSHLFTSKVETARPNRRVWHASSSFQTAFSR